MIKISNFMYSNLGLPIEFWLKNNTNLFKSIFINYVKSVFVFVVLMITTKVLFNYYNLGGVVELFLTRNF